MRRYDIQWLLFASYHLPHSRATAYRNWSRGYPWGRIRSSDIGTTSSVWEQLATSQIAAGENLTYLLHPTMILHNAARYFLPPYRMLCTTHSLGRFPFLFRQLQNLRHTLAKAFWPILENCRLSFALGTTSLNLNQSASAWPGSSGWLSSWHKADQKENVDIANHRRQHYLQSAPFPEIWKY